MVDKSKYKFLFNIDSPKDIRNLDVNDLKTVCSEIRMYMVDVISQIGGHFGGGLGTVELTVALHRVFNTPEDKVVWDTGHQAYPHKIITGRRDKLQTIRRLNGISGFLKRNESEYDAFGAGHASTSISAALGMAVAHDLKKNNRKSIAVIGDGAMTGGMAYEALNNSGVLKSNVVVVLNDNNMSIAPNVWQISKYFSEMISHPEYNKFKGAIWELTGKLDSFGDRLRKVAARLESGIKAIITPGMLFEALGFRYFGPVNGHNVVKLVTMFEQVRELNGPILVHVITEKGKGYKPAEGHVQKLHASTPFDKQTGKALPKKSGPPAYTKIFGQTLSEIVGKNKDVVGITAAMPDGTGLDILQHDYPENYFDVGIAEEHAVTFAAGLATEGIKPVVAVYSSFLQRGFDQIIHDVSLQKLHVVFAIDRAGLVGADGPTHHGVFDLTYLRMIPYMTIMSPKDEDELRHMLYSAVEEYSGPVAIRYPRGSGYGVELTPELKSIERGTWEVLREGDDAVIFATGTMVGYALAAADILAEKGINLTVVNSRFIKPLDENMIKSFSNKFNLIFTAEENTVIGGFGAGVIEFIQENELDSRIVRIGLPDDYVDHGTQAELHKILKIDAEGLAERISKKLYKTGTGAGVNVNEKA